MITLKFVGKLILIQGESAGKVSMTAVTFCIEIPIAGGSPRHVHDTVFLRETEADMQEVLDATTEIRKQIIMIINVSKQLK